MYAIIHQPIPDAVQSGPKPSDKWVIEFPRGSKTQIDPLTGKVGGSDPYKSLKLTFDNKEQAISYARAKKIPYRLIERAKHKPVSRSYADNFAFDRKFPWTH